MASGLLTGGMTRERIANLPADDWRKRSPDYQEPRLAQNLRLVEALRRIGRWRGLSPAAVAVAWVLAHPAVTGAIVGARRPGQFREVARAAGVQFDAEEIAELDEFLPRYAA
jgi:aryl-alcohol dehydrogenase-like predicted oxidoreductase